MTAPQRAIAAARAWARAEAAGRILKPGENARWKGSPKVGEPQPITDAREHFAALYGVSKNYIEMARAVLGYSDALAPATAGKPSLRPARRRDRRSRQFEQ